jgi:putative ABC transport system substrate-binding protein
MKRSKFIALIGGAAAAWPLAARAQQGRRPVVIGDPWREALRQGLRDLGYVEGRTIKTEERWAEGRNDRLDGLEQELIDSKVDIVVSMMEPLELPGNTKSRVLEWWGSRK